MAEAVNKSEDNSSNQDKLQLCFLNEAIYEEGEEDNEEVFVRPSALFIAQNNISRKKNHVIIPLTPSSEASKLLTESSDEQGELSDQEAFRLYIKDIHTEASEKLSKVRQKTKAKTCNPTSPCDPDFSPQLARLVPAATSSNSSCKFGRHALTGLNVARLQVILNMLLSCVEDLNERLVRLLIERDELVMEQDALLTDIEDITKGIKLLDKHFS